MTYACYYCRRLLPRDVVERCRKAGAPVRCPCRPGALFPSSVGNGETLVVRDARSTYSCCDTKLKPNGKERATCRRCGMTYDLAGEWAPALVIALPFPPVPAPASDALAKR